jgi:hypothetical protein
VPYSEDINAAENRFTGVDYYENCKAMNTLESTKIIRFDCLFCLLLLFQYFYPRNPTHAKLKLVERDPDRMKTSSLLLPDTSTLARLLDGVASALPPNIIVVQIKTNEARILNHFCISKSTLFRFVFQEDGSAHGGSVTEVERWLWVERWRWCEDVYMECSGDEEQ